MSPRFPAGAGSGVRSAFDTVPPFDASSHRPTLHQLEVFVRVVAYHSITRAAESLLISQPVASRILRMLESQYGIRLVSRIGRDIVPTEAGELLYQVALQTLSGFDSLHRTLKSFANAEAGHLSIGVTSSTSYIVEPVISSFMTDYPAVDIRVRVDSSDAVYVGVRNRLLDVGIVVENPSRETGLDALVLGTQEMIVIAARDHPCSALHDDVRPWALATFLSSGAAAHRTFITAELLGHLGLAGSARVLDCGSPEMVKSLVEDGVGISALIRCAVSNELMTGTLRELVIPDFHRTVGIHAIYDKRVSRLPILETFLDALSLSLNP